MQPFSYETGSALALAMGVTEASRPGMTLDPQPFTFNLDFGATALDTETSRTLKMQGDAYFAWVGTAATVFNTVDGVNVAYQNDLLKVRFLVTDRTIARERIVTASNPFDGWNALHNVSSSPGAFGGQWLFLWPLPIVFSMTEEIEFVYRPCSGAGAAGTNRLFLSLYGVKLYPFPAVA